MDNFEPFHSAVNRIPVLRRSGERLADAGRLPKSLFKDHEPPGHDRLHADRWSGSIDLEMIARTPLIFGEHRPWVWYGGDLEAWELPHRLC